MNHNKALLIIDAQRCFMPAEEGQRLGEPGFGELPVPNGHSIVPNTNRLTSVFLREGLPVVTTQDQHPEKTAHFSAHPNFVDTWPVHGRAGTPGGELHPELIAAKEPKVAHFIKGDVAAKAPADDNSYTGALAHRVNPDTDENELLPDYLRKLCVSSVALAGLTLGKDKPLCVDSTAVDLLKEGFRVEIVTDAVEVLQPQYRQEILAKLGKMGIRLVKTSEAIAEAYAVPREM
jgi:nicotinamidase/pyrazinamidase